MKKFKNFIALCLVSTFLFNITVITYSYYPVLLEDDTIPDHKPDNSTSITPKHYVPLIKQFDFWI